MPIPFRRRLIRLADNASILSDILVLLYFSVWRWKGDVFKNNLLHEYWQEGSLGSDLFLLAILLEEMLCVFSHLFCHNYYSILKIFPFCYLCSLLKLMSNTSLNLFVERFVAFHGTRLVMFIVGWILNIMWLYEIFSNVFWCVHLLGSMFEFLLLVKFNHLVKCFPSFWCVIQVQRLRHLGDYHHSTRIAFVEFSLVITH